MSYTIISQNAYNLTGSISTGMTLDNTNPLSGTVLTDWNTYGDGTYSDSSYEPCAVIELNINAGEKADQVLTWSSVGGTNDIKFQYKKNGVWSSEIDATATTTATVLDIKIFPIRFIFESSYWTDSDSITLNSVNPILDVLPLIKGHKHKMFRRLFMRRRLATTGEYETDWVQVDTGDVIKYGTVTYSVDDVIPGFFKFSGLTFQLLNDKGRYSNVSDDKSFFFGAATIARTLVKVEAGYIDNNGNERPTTPTLYVGLITDNPKYTESSKVSFITKHLSSVLDEFPADQITNFSSTGSAKTLTASEIITTIRDHQDGSGTYIFQKYISSSAWNFTTTTDTYVMSTNTTLQGLSCWKLLQQIAVAEDSNMFMGRSGNFFFQDKNIVSSASAFHFSGIGDSDKTSGHNISKKISIVEDIRNVYNRIKVQFDEDQTTTSFVINNETWNYGDVSSSSFLYGVRELNYKNTFLTQASASILSDNLFSSLRFPKDKIELQSKFLPQLSVSDQATVTYKTRQAGIGEALWGTAIFGTDRWGERLGFNIEVDALTTTILNLTHNLDSFVTTVRLREL